MSSVGVSNSCLYHNVVKAKSSSDILQYCSVTVLIVTLSQKVPYVKPQELRICHQHWKSCVLLFLSLGSWANARKCYRVRLVNFMFYKVKSSLLKCCLYAW